MTRTRVYLTTAIPYVNAAPHLGFALEAVQADVLARHHRWRGAHVRLLTGTDDNSLKNVLAAEAAGVPVRDFVDTNAAAFAALREPLALSFDDFIRTSHDPRHRAGVHRLWRACQAAGDLYRARYEGLYCVGCEHYLTGDDLDAWGRCPEHRQPPAQVAEENWFFRLSRYAAPIRAAIESGRLRIEPESRRREVLSLIDGGLRDFSVSRSQRRARGWGIPVPGDPDQVVYVWWDALGNYVTSLDYGTGGEDFGTWWTGGDRRVHVIGKGVLRFHAVYWPAMLLSAGLDLPTDILVHDYLTVDGQKISKSGGTPVDPVALAGRYGTDALRWWLLREVPRVGDADFTVDRLVNRANADLAGGVGNLVSRVVTMIHRYRDGQVPTVAVQEPAAAGLVEACRDAPRLIDQALDRFDFRRATGLALSIVEGANRYVEQVRPWDLARAERAGGPLGRAPLRREPAAGLDTALAVLVLACRSLGANLAAFLPETSARVAAQCWPLGGRLPPAAPVFPRIEATPTTGWHR